MEGLEEVLRVEVLGGCKESVDVSGDDIKERIHPVFVMEAKFLFVCLHLPEDLLLLGVEKAVDEVEGLMACLDDDFLSVLLLVSDIFDQHILNERRTTILDFCCSRADILVLSASCMLE